MAGNHITCTKEHDDDVKEYRTLTPFLRLYVTLKNAVISGGVNMSGSQCNRMDRNMHDWLRCVSVMTVAPALDVFLSNLQ